MAGPHDINKQQKDPEHLPNPYAQRSATPDIQAKLKNNEKKESKKNPEEPEMNFNALSDKKSDFKLPESLNEKMEGSFGHDFSNVNIHKNSQKADQFNALAYTQGNEIHFAPGEFQPGTKEGQELIGHELAHVVQQRDVATNKSNAPTEVQVNDSPVLEEEADEAGEKAALGTSVKQLSSLKESSVQKKGPNEPYVVQANDSFFKIADKHKVSVQDLLKVNGLKFKNRESDGQLVVVDIASGAEKNLMPGDTLNIPATTKKQEIQPAVEEQKKPATPSEDLFTNMDLLEKAAAKEGYSQKQIITALRKIYYDTDPQKEFAGAVYGGGKWGILIPGAQSTQLPKSWSADPALIAARMIVYKHKDVMINNTMVDIAHTLTGLDAANHEQAIKIAYGAAVNMRSNKEATTFVGDMGSVVGHYVTSQPNRPMRDMVKNKADKALDASFAANFGSSDMTSDADAYAIKFNPGFSVTQNLQNYYAPTGGSAKRFTSFGKSIGFLDNAGKFNYGIREQLKFETMEAAKAYQAGEGDKLTAINIYNDKGPSLPWEAHNFYDLYLTVSTWVTDAFLQKLAAEIQREGK